MCIIPAPFDHTDGGIIALVLGAAANQGVLDFIGNDVATFCDDQMKDSRT
jgi:DNA-binding ferritin-like protein (Dps family)